MVTTVSDVCNVSNVKLYVLILKKKKKARVVILPRAYNQGQKILGQMLQSPPINC